MAEEHTNKAGVLPAGWRPPAEEACRVIAVCSELDVVAARIACATLADELGFNMIEKYSAVISVSELATNILVHAGAGKLLLRALRSDGGSAGLEVVAIDSGEGIGDIDLALQDGYSSGGGLGCGLSGVARLMDELHIGSAPGRGTTVRAVRWMAQDAWGAPRSGARRIGASERDAEQGTDVEGAAR